MPNHGLIWAMIKDDARFPWGVILLPQMRGLSAVPENRAEPRAPLRSPFEHEAAARIRWIVDHDAVVESARLAHQRGDVVGPQEAVRADATGGGADRPLVGTAAAIALGERRPRVARR